MRGFAVAAAVVAVGLAGGIAQAGPPGTWTAVTELRKSTIDEVSLARTPDGVLHFAWLRQSGDKLGLVHSAVSPQGRPVGRPTTIVDGWRFLGNPALAYAGDQLVVSFGGQRSVDPNDPYQRISVFSATAPRSGGSWTLSTEGINVGAVVHVSAAGRGSDVARSWWSAEGIQAQIGLNGPPESLQPACCGYGSAVAFDGRSGTPVVAWYSNTPGRNGHFAKSLGAGAPQLAPGSVTNGRSLQAINRVALSGRIGAPGVYLAYPTGYPFATGINVWRFGSPRPQLRMRAQNVDIDAVELVSAPEGRLWLAWERDDRLYAARTNKAATRFGPVISVKRPPAFVRGLFTTAGEGSLGQLDLFVCAIRDSTGVARTWHMQVRPVLTLRAVRQRGGRIAFVVSDAGDPVAGATVSFAGRTATTNARGRAVFRLPAAGGTALTRKAGYTGASIRVGGR